ncbi:MAG TPA: FAD-dependent oxidoreductase [Terriglobia bacterium]|nr:FAD-dependent oxidoreductase [Terriglobia bacterium]
MSKPFDAIVVGAGSFGAWTALELCRRGRSVALLEAYGPGHSRASSGGESRIIRMGYGPNEVYTRWSMRALDRWQALFAQTGQPLFHPTGVLWLGRATDVDPYNAASLAAFGKLGVPHRTLSRQELARTYPQIALDEDVSWGLLETHSGVLLARRAVEAVVERAVREGVQYIHAATGPPSGDEAVRGRLDAIRTADGTSIRVGIDGAIIFACGPWLGKLFPALLGDRLFISRQEVFFFAPPAGDARFAPAALPAWIDLAHEAYGMPDLEGRGVKVGIDRHGSAFDPDTGSRIPSPEGVSDAHLYLALRFPALQEAPLVEARVCQYENTSTGDFLLDRHPAFENVWLAGGGSGHGFKHGPAVGEYLAGRILEGEPGEPRFSLESKLAVQRRAIF